MNNEINLEEVWSKYAALFRKAYGTSKQVENFLDTMGERIVLCPAGHKSDHKYAHPGGLMMQSIDMAIAMKNIAKSIKGDVDPKSILRVALGFDLGKVGTREDEYYLEQDSS